MLQVLPDTASLTALGAVKKLIIFVDPADTQVAPRLNAALAGMGARLVKAVPTMLEVLPQGNANHDVPSTRNSSGMLSSNCCALNPLAFELQESISGLAFSDCYLR